LVYSGCRFLQSLRHIFPPPSPALFAPPRPRDQDSSFCPPRLFVGVLPVPRHPKHVPPPPPLRKNKPVNASTHTLKSNFNWSFVAPSPTLPQTNLAFLFFLFFLAMVQGSMGRLDSCEAPSEWASPKIVSPFFRQWSALLLLLRVAAATLSSRGLFSIFKIFLPLSGLTLADQLQGTVRPFSFLFGIRNVLVSYFFHLLTELEIFLPARAFSGPASSSLNASFPYAKVSSACIAQVL